MGKSGLVLKVQDKDKVVQEVRISEICQLSLFGNIQLTTQAIQALCEQEVPIAYFSMGGWFYGVTHGLGVQEHLSAPRAVSPGRRARLLPAAGAGVGGGQDSQSADAAATQPCRAAGRRPWCR